MDNSRIQNSYRNMMIGTIFQVLVIIFQFFCRTVFISSLSVDYLGINGLFINIINILSLSELGFGSALVYSMYHPIAENDYFKLSQILNLFRKIYGIVAIVILVIGLGLTPFLKYIVGEKNIENLVLIYWLFIINSVVSYLWIYKKSLIEAHQQNYICSIYQKGIVLIQNVLQMAFLLWTHNYIIYILLQIISTIVSNLLLSKKADKMYPLINTKEKGYPDVVERRKIYDNTKALAFHKFGGVILGNTDNIIMSWFINISIVGLYSNYILLINNIGIFINVILTSVSASVGNLGVTENNTKSKEIYNLLQFMSFWIYSVCSGCLINLLNPFIQLWIGKKFLLDFSVMVIIVLNFYIAGMRRVTAIFIESYGISYNTKYKVVAESIINLIASIILVQRIGIAGIFIGTTIACLSVVWREVYSLYKKIFKYAVKEFYLNYIKYSLFFVISNLISYKLFSHFPESGFGMFLIRVVCSIVFYQLLFMICFFRNCYFRQILKIGLNRLRGRNKIVIKSEKLQNG